MAKCISEQTHARPVIGFYMHDKYQQLKKYWNCSGIVKNAAEYQSITKCKITDSNISQKVTKYQIKVAMFGLFSSQKNISSLIWSCWWLLDGGLA